MHIAEVVTIAKSLPLLRLNTYKSLILSYSADYRRIFSKNKAFPYRDAKVKQKNDARKRNDPHGLHSGRSNVLTSDFYGCVRRIGLCGIPGRRTENRNENSDPRKGS